MGTLATDNFNRANNADLGATWDVMTSEGSYKVVSNTAAPADHTIDSSETYNGVTWPDSQYAQCEVTTGSNAGVTLGQGPGVCVRGATGARTYYRCVIAQVPSGDKIELTRFVAGTNTSLATRPATYAAGAVLKLSANGSSLTISYNGVQAGAVVSDSGITSGRAGVSFSSGFVFNDATEFIDNWEGGSVENPSFRVNKLRPRVFAPGNAR